MRYDLRFFAYRGETTDYWDYFLAWPGPARITIYDLRGTIYDLRFFAYRGETTNYRDYHLAWPDHPE